MAHALAAGHSVDVICCCGHSFCFACSADAHEPATCQQVQIAASGLESHVIAVMEPELLLFTADFGENACF